MRCKLRPLQAALGLMDSGANREGFWAYVMLVMERDVD